MKQSKAGLQFHNTKDKERTNEYNWLKRINFNLIVDTQ